MPPESLAPAPAPVSAAAGSASRNPLWVVLGIVVVLAAIVLIYWLHFAPSPYQARVSFIEHGATTWYQVTGDTATPATHPEGYDSASVNVVNAAPALASGAVPVLALGSDGLSLGLMQNGSFTRLLGPGARYYLSDDGQGTVFYVQTSSSSEPSRLYSYEPGNPSAVPQELAVAAVAAAAPDGSVVAVTPDGIVRITPGASSTPAVLVPAPASGPLYYPAVAAGGVAAAYWDSVTNTINLYDLTKPNGTAQVASIELSQLQPTALSFTASGELVVKTGDTLTFYPVRSGSTADRTVTITHAN
ncbi:MAG TPA: hypothetical protein VF439_01005 [Candidatus Paceibacterota bacterium]